MKLKITNESGESGQNSANIAMRVSNTREFNVLSVSTVLDKVKY